MVKFLESKEKGPMFGATYTGEGFKEAQNVLQTSRRKDRKIARAVLLLTDGAPTDPEVADKTVSWQNIFEFFPFEVLADVADLFSSDFTTFKFNSILVFQFSRNIGISIPRYMLDFF